MTALTIPHRPQRSAQPYDCLQTPASRNQKRYETPAHAHLRASARGAIGCMYVMMMMLWNMTSMLPRATTISKKSHGCGHMPVTSLRPSSANRNPPAPNAMNKTLRERPCEDINGAHQG